MSKLKDNGQQENGESVENYALSKGLFLQNEWIFKLLSSFIEGCKLQTKCLLKTEHAQRIDIISSKISAKSSSEGERILLSRHVFCLTNCMHWTIWLTNEWTKLADIQCFQSMVVARCVMLCLFDRIYSA